MKHDYETVDERIAARSYQLRQMEAMQDALKDATCFAMASLESIIERSERGEIDLSPNEHIGLGFAWQALFETADQLGEWEGESDTAGTDGAGIPPIIF